MPARADQCLIYEQTETEGLPGRSCRKSGVRHTCRNFPVRLPISDCSVPFRRHARGVRVAALASATQKELPLKPFRDRRSDPFLCGRRRPIGAYVRRPRGCDLGSVPQAKNTSAKRPAAAVSSPVAPPAEPLLSPAGALQPPPQRRPAPLSTSNRPPWRPAKAAQRPAFSKAAREAGVAVWRRPIGNRTPKTATSSGGFTIVRTVAAGSHRYGGAWKASAGRAFLRGGRNCRSANDATAFRIALARAPSKRRIYPPTVQTCAGRHAWRETRRLEGR
jgi:hypothetical protein